MNEKLTDITIRPIGFVRNEAKEVAPLDSRDWGEIVSEIVIDSHLTTALDGLDEFSHIVVLFWMHKVNETGVPLKVHPRGKKELPLVGLFATRAPNRPNRIGKTTVRLLGRHGNILKVKGLDALDGSPVLDIKPYIPKDDLLGARVPPWITRK
jgi:tRNA-Thr(GGU) m(6)t(6)A37 methyltransferase TsaA